MYRHRPSVAPSLFLSQLFAGHSFYGHLSDVWAMGVVLFVSLTGVPPFSVPALSDQRFKLIYEGHIEKLLEHWRMSHIMSPLAKDCISRMLCPPERRMNIQQVLQHPFVTGANV
jgi:calcium-dependent protein kinase